jgi:hypothetical protein
MLRFRRMRSLQKFAAARASIHSLFNTERASTAETISRPMGKLARLVAR